MKIKSLIFICCLSLFSSAFADNHHAHPKANSNVDGQSATKNLKYPGACEIEIINNSFENVRVSGIFDDNSSLIPFNVYSFGIPQYISLYYYGYCHDDMIVYVDTFSGYNLYSGYTPRASTIRIVPFLNKVKVEITKK